MSRARRLFFLSCVPFFVLATSNSAGYRYGASDQAFYVPAVLERLNPALYPRDSDLIHSQARLTLMDDTIAFVAKTSRFSLPTLFLVLYSLALAILLWASLRIGERLYRTDWAIIALAAALTLRHAIMKSGTNTLEGYFHPRQLAFGLGAVAVAAFLRRASPGVLLPLTVAALLHPTTAMWFIIWLGVATFIEERRLRPMLITAAVMGALVGAWALSTGPLAGRLTKMDAEWLDTLGLKRYLFPLHWPDTVWLVNLAYAPLILWIFSRRRAAGLLVPREAAVVFGCLSLLGVFLIALLLQTMDLAIAIQLQPARIFWMLDFLATLYVVWALAESGSSSPRRAAIVATIILALSCVRSLYVLGIRYPDRRLVQLDVRDDDWGRAMKWARSSELQSHWLADPLHAAKYGTSLRVAGERDVFVEEIKDSAIGMYERPVAIRTRERMTAVGDFGSLTPLRARSLSAQYDISYLVSEQSLDLPVAFSAGPLRIYRLR